MRMPGREVEDNGVSTGRVRPSGCSSVLQTTWNLFSLKLTTQECNLAFFEAFCSAFIPSFSHCRVGIDERVRPVALMTYFLVEGVEPEHGGEQSSVFEGSVQAMSAPRRPFARINLFQIDGSLPAPGMMSDVPSSNNFAADPGSGLLVVVIRTNKTSLSELTNLLDRKKGTLGPNIVVNEKIKKLIQC